MSQRLNIWVTRAGDGAVILAPTADDAAQFYNVYAKYGRRSELSGKDFEQFHTEPECHGITWIFGIGVDGGGKP